MTAFYDLYRGITRHLDFNPDAAAGELPRAMAALTHVPQGTLLLGDRLYGVGAFFAALTSRGIAELCRRNGCQSWRWLRELSKTCVAGAQPGGHPDIEVKGKRISPRRPCAGCAGAGTRALGTADQCFGTRAVVGQRCPAPVSWRWKVERLFFDLKEVLNLHRFYTSSPNGVAMQVYAAALVHTALRVAQGHIAQASGIEPEEIAPAKFFPILAAASIGLTWSELAFLEIQQANPA